MLEIKNIVIEINSLMHWSEDWQDRERISESEDLSLETSQTRMQREKTNEKTEQNIHKMIMKDVRKM